MKLRLFKTLFGLASLLILAALAVWTWPSLIVTKGNISRLASYLENRGMKLTWKELVLDTRSETFLTKTIRVAAKELCLAKTNEWSFCVNGFQAEAKATVLLAQKKKVVFEIPNLSGDISRFSVKGTDLEVEGSGKLHTGEKSAGTVWIDLQGRVSQGSGEAARFTASSSVSIAEGNLLKPESAVGKLDISNKENKHAFQWEATKTNDVLELKARLRGQMFVGQATPIDLHLCKIKWTNQSISSSCDIAVDTENFAHLDNVEHHEPLPISMTADFHRAGSHWSGAVKVTPLDVTANVDMSDGMKADVMLPEFQKLVELLHETPWAIPSPINALKGKCELRSEMRFSSASALAFPVIFKTRLKSTRQQLDLDGQGTVKFGTKDGGADLELIFSDVKLELPRVDLGLRHNEQSKKKTGFKLSVRAKTGAKPVKLLIDGKGEIPIAVALYFTDQGLGGEVREFSAEKIQPQESRLPIIVTDPTTHGLVLSLVEHQRVRLVSQRQPAMVTTPKIIPDGIINVDRVLAAAPVEGVDFDRNVGRFNTKLKLGEGTLVNVGLDVKKLNEIGFRKRLGENWNVITYLQSPLDPVGRSLTAFLEWSLAY